MQVIGRRDYYRVDRFFSQKVVMRGVDFSAAICAADGAIPTAFVCIHNTHDPGLRMLRDGIHQLLSARARTDHTDVDAVARGGLRIGRGRGQQHARLQQGATGYFH